MTAENLGTNSTIGKVIKEEINFNHNTEVQGCVSHVINPTTKEGLKVSGEILNDKEAKPKSNIHNIFLTPPPPNVTQVNLKPIYNCCHGLVTRTWSSPQHAQTFKKIVEIIQGHATALNRDPVAEDPAPTNPVDPAIADAVYYLMQDRTIDDDQPSPRELQPSTAT